MKSFGKNGFGDVITCRRYYLPSNIPPQYFHKIKTDYKQQSKESRFLHPDLVLKETYAQGGNKHTNLHISFYNLSHHAIFLQLIPFLNSSYKLKVDYVDAETISVSGVSKWMMPGVSNLQRISKLIWWTTSSKIVEYSIDHKSIGINQCSMKNPLQMFSHKKSTRSVQRVGLTVNGKLNTQLTSGHLYMCCRNKYCNTHQLINYSPVTKKWEPPRCRRKVSAGELQAS